MKSIHLIFLFCLVLNSLLCAQSVASTEVQKFCKEVNEIQLSLDGKNFNDPASNKTYRITFPKENFNVLFSSGLGFKAEYKALESDVLYVTEGIDFSTAKDVITKPTNSKSDLQIIEILFQQESILTKSIEKGKVGNTINSDRMVFYYLLSDVTQKNKLVSALKGLVKLLSKNAETYHQSQNGTVSFPEGVYYGTYVGVNKRREGTGTFTFKDGSVYTGEWKDDKMHGKGKLKSNQIVEISGDKVKNRRGVEYNGKWVEGKLQGMGRAKDIGIDYDGNFVDGRIESKGTLIYSGSVKWTYVGEWKNFKFQGRGILMKEYDRNPTYGYGDTKYEGFFVDGKRNGKGILETNGAVYEGVWSDDNLNGAGIYTKGEVKYIGNFRNGFKSGYGTETNEKESYKGEWKGGNMNGKGEYIWKNGDRYDGLWDGGSQSGKGVMYYGNGDKFDGEWTGKRFEGWQIWKNGTSYSGEWSNDTMHGKGSMRYLNGERFEGEWLWGKPHQGSFYDKNNVIIKNVGLESPDFSSKYLRTNTEALSRDKTFFTNYKLTDTTLVLYLSKSIEHKIYFDSHYDNIRYKGSADISYLYHYNGYIYLTKSYYKEDPKRLPTLRYDKDIVELTYQLQYIVNPKSKGIAFQLTFNDGNGNLIYVPKRSEEINFDKGKVYYIEFKKK